MEKFLGYNSRTDVRIRELETTSTEMIQFEKPKKERMKTKWTEP